ncbi:hypothetical protein TWF281_003238 [Arthrobotrys megalospora]
METPSIRLRGNNHAQLLTLPTEVCQAILSFLGPEVRANFAKCSRQCYLIAFPVRFRGVIISEGRHEAGLREFTSGGWLEPVKYCVRSVKFTLHGISTLASLLPRVCIFPKSTRLTIELSGTGGLERNIYVATISSLSRLSSCNNLEHLTLRFSRYPARPCQLAFQTDLDSLSSYIDSTEEESNGESQVRSGATSRADITPIKHINPDPLTNLSDALRDREEKRTYSGIHALLTDEEKYFLGPYIANRDLTSTLRVLTFPRSLLSLDIDIPDAETFNFLSYFNCSANVGLSLKDYTNPIRDPNGPAVDIELPTVSRLSLSFTYGEIYSKRLEGLPKQFPNLESLTLSHWGSYAAKDVWKDCIPDLPNLREIGLPWPRNGPLDLSFIECDVKKRLGIGEFKCLQSIKLFRPNQWNGNATCKILRDDKEVDGTQGWVFAWSDDTSDHQGLESSSESGPFGEPDGGLQWDFISSF